MKREEKNLQSRQKIIESALKEFSSQGYGLSSINTICNEGNISKGVLYHYFSDKDEVYLTCVKECFDELVDYLRSHGIPDDAGLETQLEAYFDARLAFFQDCPQYQSLFSEALMSPPKQLAEAIYEIRADFDALNIDILNSILEQVELRPGMTKTAVIDLFRQYQEFINMKYRAMEKTGIDIAAREENCKQAVDVLLYGVIARDEAKE